MKVFPSEFDLDVNFFQNISYLATFFFIRQTQTFCWKP